MKYNLSLSESGVGGELTSFAVDSQTNTLYGVGDLGNEGLTFISFDVRNQSAKVKPLALSELSLYPGMVALDSHRGQLYTLANDRSGAVNLLSIDTKNGDVAARAWCNDSIHSTARDRFACGKNLFFVQP